MFEELRDWCEVVLLVNVSPDDEKRIRAGNPRTRIISYKTTGGNLREAGFRIVVDFQEAKKGVDLVIFGPGVSVLVAVSVLSRSAQCDGLVVFEWSSGSIGVDDLAASGAVDARVFSLHRLPGWFGW
jgi:hypothetical protein